MSEFAQYIVTAILAIGLIFLVVLVIRSVTRDPETDISDRDDRAASLDELLRRSHAKHEDTLNRLEDEDR